jgi:hypothetical protein
MKAMRAYHSLALRLAGALFVVSLLGGCGSLVLSLVGAGAGAEYSHNRASVATRTFSIPFTEVKAAMLIVMFRLEIETDTTEHTDTTEIINGVAGNRKIEVEIETLSSTMTRVSVVARTENFRPDAATAQEIIAQTARALGVV